MPDILKKHEIENHIRLVEREVKNLLSVEIDEILDRFAYINGRHDVGNAVISELLYDAESRAESIRGYLQDICESFGFHYT